MVRFVTAVQAPEPQSDKPFDGRRNKSHDVSHQLPSTLSTCSQDLLVHFLFNFDFHRKIEDDVVMLNQIKELRLRRM